jgi:hypothetical protein
MTQRLPTTSDSHFPNTSARVNVGSKSKQGSGRIFLCPKQQQMLGQNNITSPPQAPRIRVTVQDLQAPSPRDRARAPVTVVITHSRQ